MEQPMMGLSPLYIERVLELIETINQQGVTVFMVEQNANLALQIAHYGYVLQNGRIVLSGWSSELLNNLQIRDAYLSGETVSQIWCGWTFPKSDRTNSTYSNFLSHGEEPVSCTG